MQKQISETTTYHLYNVRGQEKSMGEEENRRNLEGWKKVLED